jgi:hypothetical protein
VGNHQLIFLDAQNIRAILSKHKNSHHYEERLGSALTPPAKASVRQSNPMHKEIASSGKTSSSQ